MVREKAIDIKVDKSTITVLLCNELRPIADSIPNQNFP